MALFSKYHDSYIPEGTRLIGNKLLWSSVSLEGLGRAEVWDLVG